MSKGGLSQRQVGASKLEWVVATLIFSILVGWLLHTFSFYQELTEKTVVESTVTNLRSGLRFKIAALIIHGEADKQSLLEKTNPVQFLEKPPKDYLGEMRTPGNLPPGSWYYEQDSAELVYIPNLKNNLLLLAGDRQKVLQLRWQIKAREGSGVQAVDVELLTPYSWF